MRSVLISLFVVALIIHAILPYALLFRASQLRGSKPASLLPVLPDLAWSGGLFTFVWGNAHRRLKDRATTAIVFAMRLSTVVALVTGVLLLALPIP